MLSGVIAVPTGPNVDISAVDPLAPRYKEWDEKAKQFQTAEVPKRETLPFGADRLGRDEARSILFRIGIPERDTVIDQDRGITGAAVLGSGVQATGMWPSPAARPEVGSRPIQPAPGR